MYSQNSSSEQWPCGTLLLLAAAKSLQSCPINGTLCDPTNGSPPGSPVPGILQARTLEWAAISFSNAWKWKVKVKSLSRVQLFETPWTAAHQAPLPMGFSRQECWSGLPLPSPLQYPKDPQISKKDSITSSVFFPGQERGPAHFQSTFDKEKTKNVSAHCARKTNSSVMPWYSYRKIMVYCILINAWTLYLERSGQALIHKDSIVFFLTYSLIRWVNI